VQTLQNRANSRILAAPNTRRVVWMNISDILIILAVAWPTVGFLVAVLIGRMFRDAAAGSDELTDRLVC
jgi:hypothetical protein